MKGNNIDQTQKHHCEQERKPTKSSKSSGRDGRRGLGEPALREEGEEEERWLVRQRHGEDPSLLAEGIAACINTASLRNNANINMKIVLASILAAAVPAAAFAPSMSRPVVSTSLSAAKSAAEDLELTLKVIMENMVDDGSGIDDSDDDTPYEPPTPAAPAAASSGVELWSVDYDAAARLAYEAAGSSGDFASFKSKYLEETSAMVGKKGLL